MTSGCETYWSAYSEPSLHLPLTLSRIDRCMFHTTLQRRTVLQRLDWECKLSSIGVLYNISIYYLQEVSHFQIGYASKMTFMFNMRETNHSINQLWFLLVQTLELWIAMFVIRTHFLYNKFGISYTFSLQPLHNFSLFECKLCSGDKISKLHDNPHILNLQM